MDRQMFLTFCGNFSAAVPAALLKTGMENKQTVQMLNTLFEKVRPTQMGVAFSAQVAAQLQVLTENEGANL